VNKIIFSTEHDPAYNLALEEELLYGAAPGETALYLWQNDKTVVIGRNQNPYAECDLKRMAQFGVKLVRRMSGGGAVYHDLGNLNFTFINKTADQDLEKQYLVLLDILQNLGVPAVRSGRNDLTANGQKFSGHAFYEEDGNAFHHGTLMVSVDLKLLQASLTPSAYKLENKGIVSVGSRVINLSEINPAITVEALAGGLVQGFRHHFGTEPVPIRLGRRNHMPPQTVKYESDAWTFGQTPAYNARVSRNTPQGSIEAYINVENGIVQDIKIYSDSITVLDFSGIERAIKNTPFHLIDWEKLLP